LKPKTKVVIIDDEIQIRRFLKASLPPDEYELHEAENGEGGIRLVASTQPDVVLLDLWLPDIDGTEVARRIREWSSVPIIVLSARHQESDKVAALDLGADDYLTKPFGINELLARVRVALRHRSSNAQSEPVFQSGQLKVDQAKRQVFVDGEEIHLTPHEYALLATLIKHAGMVVTHKHLLTEVWGSGYEQESHYLRVYMAQLRQKIEKEPASPEILLTEPGVGYRLVAL